MLTYESEYIQATSHPGKRLARYQRTTDCRTKSKADAVRAVDPEHLARIAEHEERVWREMAEQGIAEHLLEQRRQGRRKTSKQTTLSRTSKTTKALSR